MLENICLFDELNTFREAFIKFKNENRLYDESEKLFIRKIFFDIVFKIFDQIFSYFYSIPYVIINKNDNSKIEGSQSSENFYSNLKARPYLFNDNSIFKVMDGSIKMLTKIYDLFFDHLNKDLEEQLLNNFLEKIIFFLDFSLNNLIEHNTSQAKENQFNLKINSEKVEETIRFIFELFILITQKEISLNSFLSNEKQHLIILDEYSRNLQNLRKGNSQYLKINDYVKNKINICDELHNLAMKYLLSFIIKDFSLDKFRGHNKNRSLNDLLSGIIIEGIFIKSN